MRSYEIKTLALENKICVIQSISFILQMRISQEEKKDLS